MSKLRFVGWDVHKDTIVVAVVEEGPSEAVTHGTYPHDVAKLVKRLTNSNQKGPRPPSRPKTMS